MTNVGISGAELTKGWNDADVTLELPDVFKCCVPKACASQ